MEYALLNDMELLLWHHVKQSHVEIASTAKFGSGFSQNSEEALDKLGFLVLSIHLWWGETL